MAQTSRSEFAVAERFAAGIPVISFAGDLDYATVATVRQRFDRLVDAGHDAAIVDVSRVTLITSPVINVLFAAVRRLRLAGGAMAIIGASPNLRKVFALTSFDRAAALCSSEQDALAVLARSVGGRAEGASRV